MHLELLTEYVLCVLEHQVHTPAADMSEKHNTK